jgi:hypothetical protein
VLARKNVDEAIPEIRRLREDSDQNEAEDCGAAISHNGKRKYFVVRGEGDLIHRLNDGWRLVQPLNHEKYLLEHS